MRARVIYEHEKGSWFISKTIKWLTQIMERLGEKKLINVFYIQNNSHNHLYMKYAIRAKYNKDLPWLIAT